MFKLVAVIVVLSEIKLPAVALTATDTEAIFLMVISRPAPANEALGSVIVCDEVEPEKTIKL